MLEYDSIYFLHIMKTGGRHLRNSVFIPISAQLEKNNIKIINNNYRPHTGWHSKITDKTYIVTSLRDPIEQVVSLFAHGISLDLDGNKANKYDQSDLEKNKLLNSVSKINKYQNFQSKSYLCNELGDQIIKNGEFIFDEVFEKRKNRVNLVLRTEDITGNEKKIQEKIFSDLGIANITETKPIFFNNKNFYNSESKKLYNSLSDNDKKNILEYNKIDQDLYNNAKYFEIKDWKNKND